MAARESSRSAGSGSAGRAFRDRYPVPPDSQGRRDAGRGDPRYGGWVGRRELPSRFTPGQWLRCGATRAGATRATATTLGADDRGVGSAFVGQVAPTCHHGRSTLHRRGAPQLQSLGIDDRCRHQSPPLPSGSRPSSRRQRVSAISGSPIKAVGSSDRRLSNSAIPSPSALKLPAQSSGCSRST